MGNMYRNTTIVLDRVQIFKSIMAEYALISTGKTDEKDIPMQYAKCDLEGIFKVIYAEEVGYVCSRMMGYADSCSEEGTLMKIGMHLSSRLDTTVDTTLRMRIESYLIAAVLMRFLMSVPSARNECVALERRAKASLRAVRHILAAA